MPVPTSPLRYPGGKQILVNLLSRLIRTNGCEGGTYIEPYAGGCGAGLTLLFGEHVSRLVINDADRSIFAFWHSILKRTNQFLELVETTPISVKEWERQRAVYQKRRSQPLLALGFATFYLNRCNRSGVIANGGIIGGKDQTGPWKIGARFNRTGLMRRIQRIAAYRDRITILNHDAVALLRVIEEQAPTKCFVYLDPPYFIKGNQLYLDYYTADDHAELASYLQRELPVKWVLTYDNAPAIRKLYKTQRQFPFSLLYSASKRHTGREVLIVPDDIKFPLNWGRRIPWHSLGLSRATAAQS